VANGDDLLTERLLRVIDEGRRTATYKLALLLALIDGVAASPGLESLPTRRIAGDVLARYYPQTRLYIANDGMERELRQITMKGSPVLRAALRLRLVGDAARCRSVSEVRDRRPDEYGRALDVVEDTFVRYPIPLLQVVGTKLVPFLYEADWPEGTSVSRLRRGGRDAVRFLPGVTDRLVVLGPLLRPLIELHWARDVARWTGVSREDDRLRAHLFGSDRVGFPPSIKVGLAELQDGRCFYCGDPLGSKVEVDHFLAWSRWPNDAVENLVVADRCNGAKSDHLVDGTHLRHWLEHRDLHRDALVELAASARWMSDAARSDGLVRSTYSHVARGTPLWVTGREFVEADGPLLPT
jgi:5-methylcytosine-specific restriction endonuclease McrA